MTNSEIISQAKGAVKGRRWKLIVQLIIQGLIVQISTNVINIFTGDNLTASLYSNAFFWVGSLSVGFLVTIISNFLLRNIYRAIMQDVKGSGNKTINYLNLFSGTRITGKRFLIVTIVYTIISILFFVPAVLLHLFSTYVLPNNFIIGVLLIIAYILTIIALYVLMIFFTFYLFIEIDDPDNQKTMGQILKETTTLLAGRKWQYVRLVIKQLKWLIIFSILVLVFFTVVLFIHPLAFLVLFLFAMLPIMLILIIFYMYLMPQVYYSQILFYLDVVNEKPKVFQP